MTVTSRNNGPAQPATTRPGELAIGLVEELGLRPIIHAGGTKTTMGGTRIDVEVRNAMWSACDVFVPVAELAKATGTYIAQITGAEAGTVTSGAAGACVLSMAACMTGTDKARIARLPDTTGMPDELIIMRTHVGRYTHLYRRAGARIIEVGTMNECHGWEIFSAVTERTAAIAWLEGPGIRQVGPGLREVCREARRLGVPVIADIAAMLPPRANLRRYVEEGADLVTVSGGKVIGGPQNTGLLYGRADLIAAAVANNSPQQGIGRPFKVSKEDMIGLYVALRRFVSRDESAQLERWRRMLEPMAASLRGSYPGRVEIRHDEHLFHVPMLVIEDVATHCGRSASAVSAELLAGEPRVFVPGDDSRDHLTVNPVSLLAEELPIVAARLADVLG
ncbi:hypothetical protein [Streptomyces sp. NPDC007205]|uniref:aminotransferase class V-fold PLP-dependent enzyme n=1 Tax=Streptomyces sp. NPDC007205 TaxID=3154316 RepID=UPI0033E8475C